MEFGGDVQTPGLVARRTWAKGVRPLHGYKMKTKECKRLAGLSITHNSGTGFKSECDVSEAGEPAP